MSETPDICFRCKQSGHFASKCPTKQKGNQSNQAPSAPQPRPVPQVIQSTPQPIKVSLEEPSKPATEASADICYRCKQTGHLASKCPTKKRKLEDDQSAKQPITHSSNPPIHPSRSIAQSVAQAAKPFVDQSVKPVPAVTQPAKPVPADAVCYRCKAVGEHLAKDCPTKKAKAEQTKASAPVADAPTDDSRACYKCGQRGHMSRECTNEPVNKSNNQSNKRVKSESSDPAEPSVKPKCYRCYSPDHVTVDCPLPKPCHYCQSTEHLAAACVNKKQILRERTQEQIKQSACMKCNELGHIARACPNDANRIVLRDETKPRSLTCYICDSIAHHAVECVRLTELKDRMTYLIANPANLDSKMAELMSLCARALDYNSAVYVYQRLVERNQSIEQSVWDSLEALNSKSGKTHSMELPEIQKIRRAHGFIKDLVTAHRLAINQTNNQPLVNQAIKLFTQKPALLADCANRFALCKILVSSMSLSAKQARDTVAALAKKGHLIEGKKLIEFNPKGLSDEELEAKKAAKLAEAALDKKAKAKKAKKLKEKALKKAKKAAVTSTTAVTEPMEVSDEE